MICFYSLDYSNLLRSLLLLLLLLLLYLTLRNHRLLLIVTSTDHFATALSYPYKDLFSWRRFACPLAGNTFI